MGGLTPELEFAWQMKRELYLPFLRSANDTQSDPESIMSEELLAQIVHQFLLTVFRPHDLPNAAL